MNRKTGLLLTGARFSYGFLKKCTVEMGGEKKYNINVLTDGKGQVKWLRDILFSLRTTRAPL